MRWALAVAIFTVLAGLLFTWVYYQLPYPADYVVSRNIYLVDNGVRYSTHSRSRTPIMEIYRWHTDRGFELQRGTHSLEESQCLVALICLNKSATMHNDGINRENDIWAGYELRIVNPFK